MYRFFALLFFIFSFAASAELAAQGLITLNEEPAVRELQDRRKAVQFDKKRRLTAWSVQVLVTRERHIADQKKAEINRRYSDLHADWEYDYPYYRVNMGAYFTKLDAEGLLYKLKRHYPQAYIIKNKNIKPADFKASM